MFVKAKLINYTLPVNKLHLIALVTFLSLLVVFNQLYIYIYRKKITYLQTPVYLIIIYYLCILK